MNNDFIEICNFIIINKNNIKMIECRDVFENHYLEITLSNDKLKVFTFKTEDDRNKEYNNILKRLRGGL